jgi:hypothetical protein
MAGHSKKRHSMVTMYRVSFDNWKIEALEVVKNTPRQVVHKSRSGSSVLTENKTTANWAWFDTYAQANTKRIQILNAKIAQLEIELDRLNEQLENALNEAQND